MKKLTSLQILVFMGLALGSVDSIYSKCGCQQASVEVSESSQMTPVVEVSTMKSLEHEIHDIRHNVKKSGDAESAFIELDRIAGLVPGVVARLKANDGGEKGHMWRVHEHTLNRKVDDARTYAASHAE